ncbi:DUF4202 family protein [Candidatus Microgenomates bacterium]|nr:DUF4202 family protein [Candidatus Microgenomates bacterium]
MRYFKNYSPEEKVKKMQKILEEIFNRYPERTKTVSAGLEPAHAQDTLKWVLEIDPTAGIPLQIAALFHDVDRIESGFSYSAYNEGDIQHYEKYKRQHADRSANFTAKIMTDNGYGDVMTKKVKFLIANHDNSQSNDKELQILQTADALSYFSLLLRQHYEEIGDHIDLKCRFMIKKMNPEYRTKLKEISIDPRVKKIIETILTEESNNES